MRGGTVAAVAALVAAQAQGAWNRLRRESGLAGRAATGAMLLLVAAVLALPSALLLRLGLRVGGELAAGEPAPLWRWQALQALLVGGCGALGGWRFRPAFRHAELARLPIPPRALLLAELPAALFEALPLVGTAGIAASCTGLALAVPSAALWIGALAAAEVLALLALLVLSAALLRLAARPDAGVALVVATGVLLSAGGRAGWERSRLALRATVERLVELLPWSRGWDGLVAWRAGERWAGLGGLAVAAGGSLLLLGLAAALHARALARPAGAGSALGRAWRGPRGLGGLFVAQLLDSAQGRAALLLPLLLSAPLAVLVAAARAARARGDVLPGALPEALDLERIPFAWIPFVVVGLGSAVWLNQFGWDRGGVRTLLLLPVGGERLLAGKMAGLAGFAALQTALAALPLLALAPPRPAELAQGIAHGAVALFVVGGAGQWLSLRAPRPVPREGSASLPLRHAWIPAALVLACGSLLGAAGLLAAEFGEAAEVACAVALALAAAVAYRAALPHLARALARERERLLVL